MHLHSEQKLFKAGEVGLTLVDLKLGSSLSFEMLDPHFQPSF